MRKTVAFSLLALVMLLSNIQPTLAFGPPRPPSKPRPPSAWVAITNNATVLSPNPIIFNQPITYTFEIGNASDSPLVATNAVFELPFLGTQQLLNITVTNPHWKLRDPVVDPQTNTLNVDLGTLEKGDNGKIIVQATFGNYDRTIFFQTVYLDWVDTYWTRHLGTDLKAPIAVPPTGPSPQPGVPGSGQPSPTPPPSDGSTTPAGPPATGPFAPVADPHQPNTDTQWYFPATHHTLHGEFLNYWRTHGSLISLGYPTSEEFQENGRTIQYFERVVMEFWPENQPPYDVLLRSLGRTLGGVQPSVAANSPPPDPDSVYYPETGHWLDGQFVEAWQAGGGLAQYGFPIQEPVVVDNKLIQWTERARFELDLSRPNQLVLLGLVGNEDAQKRGLLGGS